MKNDDSKPINLPSKLFLEISLLCSMFLTLLISSDPLPIMVWNKLSPLLFIRASIWLFGLSILPGLYVLRLTRIVENLSEIGKIAVEVNLSLALVGLITLVLYYVAGNIILLPWLLLGILVILSCMNWLKSKVCLVTFARARPKFSEWNVLLTIAIVVTIFMAFSVQLALRYLVGGDNWVALRSAVEVISQRNVYEGLTGQYPVMFGFILAGLSISSGLPVVNTNVLLFPLVTLNVLSFFTLLKVVFHIDDRVGVVASIVYGFSGGLGWLIQTLIFHGEKSFWSLSMLSQDMYFFMPFWNDIQFSYKSLALTLAYTSIITFVISTRLKQRAGKMVSLTLSSLLMVFSFFIHMLEPMILAPVILIIAYFYQKGRNRYGSLGLFALITILFAYIMDLFMIGYYSWLTGVKVQTFLSTVSVDNLYYLLLPLGGCFIIVLIRRFLSNGLENLQICKDHSQTIKHLFVVGLIGIYVSGLLFWSLPSLELSSSFPWYLYVTRYGFVGIFALIGVGTASWREKWFLVTSFWSIFVLLMGSLWWGSRINAYLFPMVALLGAVGINKMWTKADSSIHIAVVKANSLRKVMELNLRPIIASLTIIMLGLSFTSLIYGASYYGSTEPSITDDEAAAFLWINQNVSENATILTPKTYVIYKGVQMISDRETYWSDTLPTTVDATSFINLTETLGTQNIRFAVSTEDEGETSLVDLLLSYSTLVFQSGNVKVLMLPPLCPPSSKEYTVAVVDRELLGFLGDARAFGWIDDSFLEGWFYRNVMAESDGEVLTFKWDFHTQDESEPSMKKFFSPIETNTYPYIVVKYRNTAETSANAEENVGQIISLVNEEGYPKGFVENFYLPVSKDNAFHVLAGKLPENNSIAEVGIWMRNYEKLNGTIGLQIDYIGFASSESIVDPCIDLRFLTMALPALWPAKYSIFSNFNEVRNASILISTYDESVLNYIENATYAHTFFFLNLTASFPSWGTEWRNVKTGIISGYLEEMKVVVVGIESIRQEGMANIAESIYEINS